MSTIIQWIPRVLGFLFVGFLSLFALDVFGEYQGAAVVLPLIMHLLPSLALLAVVVLAWRFELVGAVFFLAAAVGYVVMAGFDRPWAWYAFIAGPAALVGILYLVSWWRTCPDGEEGALSS